MGVGGEERKGGDLEDAQVAAFHRRVSCAGWGCGMRGQAVRGRSERAEFRWGQVELPGLKGSPEFVSFYTSRWVVPMGLFRCTIIPEGQLLPQKHSGTQKPPVLR